jgi:hypothetical protein
MKSKFDELVSCFSRKVSGMEIDQKYKTELLGMITAVGIAHRKEQLEIIHCRSCRYWKREEPFTSIGRCGIWAYTHRKCSDYCSEARRIAND